MSREEYFIYIEIKNENIKNEEIKGFGERQTRLEEMVEKKEEKKKNKASGLFPKGK